MARLCLLLSAKILPESISHSNPHHLTLTIEDPIFSDRQQWTFADLFWLSNCLGQHILEILGGNSSRDCQQELC